MRDDDMAHRLALQRRRQRPDVLVKRRPRVDDGDRAVADDIGSGPVEGERPGITGDHATHQRRQTGGDAIFELEGLVEGDFHIGAASGRFRR